MGWFTRLLGIEPEVVRETHYIHSERSDNVSNSNVSNISVAANNTAGGKGAGGTEKQKTNEMERLEKTVEDLKRKNELEHLEKKFQDEKHERQLAHEKEKMKRLNSKLTQHEQQRADEKVKMEGQFHLLDYKVAQHERQRADEKVKMEGQLHRLDDKVAQLGDHLQNKAVQAESANKARFEGVQKKFDEAEDRCNDLNLKTEKIEEKQADTERKYDHQHHEMTEKQAETERKLDHQKYEMTENMQQIVKIGIYVVSFVGVILIIMFWFFYTRTAPADYIDMQPPILKLPHMKGCQSKSGQCKQGMPFYASRSSKDDQYLDVYRGSEISWNSLTPYSENPPDTKETIKLAKKEAEVDKLKHEATLKEKWHDQLILQERSQKETAITLTQRDGEIERLKQESAMKEKQRESEVERLKQEATMKLTQRDETEILKQEAAMKVKQLEVEIEILKKDAAIKSTQREAEIERMKQEAAIKETHRETEVERFKQDMLWWKIITTISIILLIIVVFILVWLLPRKESIRARKHEMTE